MVSNKSASESPSVDGAPQNQKICVCDDTEEKRAILNICTIYKALVSTDMQGWIGQVYKIECITYDGDLILSLVPQWN